MLQVDYWREYKGVLISQSTWDIILYDIIYRQKFRGCNTMSHTVVFAYIIIHVRSRSAKLKSYFVLHRVILPFSSLIFDSAFQKRKMSALEFIYTDKNNFKIVTASEEIYFLSSLFSDEK